MPEMYAHYVIDLSVDVVAIALILDATHFGLPPATTHGIGGAVLGSAAGRPDAQVRWATAVRMAIVWPLTLPAAAAMGAA